MHLAAESHVDRSIDGPADAQLLIVHVSTDYVFDGTKDRAYLKIDSVCPHNVYGRTKEAGTTGGSWTPLFDFRIPRRDATLHADICSSGECRSRLYETIEGRSS